MMLALVARVAVAGGAAAFRGPRLVFIGAAYVGVLFPYFALLRNGPGGIDMLLLVILLAVVSDSGAYFIGMYLGRTKLAPKVSPNKTVEGAVGGLIATMAAGWLLLRDTRRVVECGPCPAIFGYDFPPRAAWRPGRLGIQASRGSQGLGLDFSGARRSARSNLFASLRGGFRLLLVSIDAAFGAAFSRSAH